MREKNQNEIENLEREIEKQQRNVSFDTKEYTIEIIVQKYLSEIDNEQNEFFVRNTSENLFGILYASRGL